MLVERLLIIDDKKDITDLLEQVAISVGYSYHSVNDFESIPYAYTEIAPTVVFLDLDLGLNQGAQESDTGEGGLEVLNFLSERESSAKIIIISGLSRRKRELIQSLGLELGLHVVGHLSKPFDVDKVEEVLERLRDAAEAEEQL